MNSKRTNLNSKKKNLSSDDESSDSEQNTNGLNLVQDRAKSAKPP